MEKYKIVRYGQWWYGILNTETDIMLRVGPNPNYNGPLDDKENKLLLFKSKDKAQEYIDNNLNSSIVEESIQSNKIKPIFAKWDDKNKYIIVSKEEYEDWDEISPKVFYSLYLIDADRKLKEEATKILDKWYEEEKSHYNIRNEFLTFVKNTLHNKIMNCKSLEDRNIIWQVIDENQININPTTNELKESNLAYSTNIEDDFDERWDKEFGQYMDGIQVMKADDAINLLKRMEKFE